MITSLIKLLKALNSEQSPRQLAIAISLSTILGLTPLYSLHNLLILFIAFSFRVNLSLFFLSYPLFALLGYLSSSIFESVGSFILLNPNLVDLWQWFFNTVVGRWSNFYYSGVMGSLIVSVLFALILYPTSKSFIKLYRSQFLETIEKYQFIRLLKTSTFWKLYEKY
jgi:uncharacterized protein (TIGR03546 family)